MAIRQKLAEAAVVMEAVAVMIAFVVALAMIGGCVMPLGPGAKVPVAMKRTTT